MDSAMKRVYKIRQIVQLKQLVRQWKALSLRRGPLRDSDPDPDPYHPPRRIPAGFLAVYVGPERRRFVIPTHYLNLPIFVSLLNKAEEEFGFQCRGGLVLPCDADFFRGVLTGLEKDHRGFGKLDLDEVLKLFNEKGFDCCRDGQASCHGFTPLLQKARV